MRIQHSDKHGLFEPDLRTMQELVIEKLTGIMGRVHQNDFAHKDLAMCIKAIASGNLQKHN